MDSLFSFELFRPENCFVTMSDQQEEEGNEDMEKKFAVLIPATLKYKTYEEAEKVAKQSTATNGSDYVIVQAIASTLQPVPEIEVVKF